MLIPALEQYHEEEQDKSRGLQYFIDRMKDITELKRFTSELVNEFIDLIAVSAPVEADGKRTQASDIFYNGIGIACIPES